MKLVPVPVDDHGIDVQAGIAAAPEAQLALVTPSHLAAARHGDEPAAPDRAAELGRGARRLDRRGRLLRRVPRQGPSDPGAGWHRPRRPHPLCRLVQQGGDAGAPLLGYVIVPRPLVPAPVQADHILPGPGARAGARRWRWPSSSTKAISPGTSRRMMRPLWRAAAPRLAAGAERCVPAARSASGSRPMASI